jgi:hypothetical protein
VNPFAYPEDVTLAALGRARQALAILDDLNAWCNAKPGRKFLAYADTDGRTKVSLVENETVTTSGADLADALAQAAMIGKFSDLADFLDAGAG